MAGAFWSIPRGKWTIDIIDDQVMVLCDGKMIAVGGNIYFDEMIDVFRRYQWSATLPDCRICGHEHHNHLKPMGFELSVFTEKPYREACHWGGGLEGWCYCPGYQPETEKKKYDGRHCLCPDHY
jgi:hypothetical protein